MVDRTYRASMAPPIEKPLNPERSEILSQLLMKMASQSQPIARPGDPPAVAWQPAMNILASALAGKKADRLQGQKSNRLAQLLGEVTSPVQEVTPGTQPEVLPQGVSGPTRPGTPDIVTERPRTLDETIGLLGQSPEGQPLANEVLLHKLKQQIESQFGQKTQTSIPNVSFNRGNQKVTLFKDPRDGQWKEESGRSVGEGRGAAVDARALRNEFRNSSKDFIEVRDSYGRINTSSKSPSPAGDLSMIFNYMKMLDPQSVVRESEFAVAANAAPLLQRYGLDPDKLMSVWEGKRLTDSQRADFLNRAHQLYQRQEQSHLQLEDEYGSLADQIGVPRSHVLIDFKYREKDNKNNPKTNQAPSKITLSPEEKMELEQLRKEFSQ